MFEQMLTYGNHPGLYAEETGPQGEALDNFPQPFPHLSLISAVFSDALGRQRAHCIRVTEHLGNYYLCEATPETKWSP